MPAVDLKHADRYISHHVVELASQAPRCTQVETPHRSRGQPGLDLIFLIFAISLFLKQPVHSSSGTLPSEDDRHLPQQDSIVCTDQTPEANVVLMPTSRFRTTTNASRSEPTTHTVESLPRSAAWVRAATAPPKDPRHAPAQKARPKPQPQRTGCGRPIPPSHSVAVFPSGAVLYPQTQTPLS